MSQCVAASSVGACCGVPGVYTKYDPYSGQVTGCYKNFSCTLKEPYCFNGGNGTYCKWTSGAQQNQIFTNATCHSAAPYALLLPILSAVFVSAVRKLRKA